MSISRPQASGIREPRVDFQVLLSLINSPVGQYAEETQQDACLLYKTATRAQGFSGSCSGADERAQAGGARTLELLIRLERKVDRHRRPHAGMRDDLEGAAARAH